MLKIENLKKTYGEFTLDCSLEVKAGCVTGFIGKNGAGKSTAFKSVLNLIHPDEGNIKLFGKDVAALDIQDKQRLGVVLADSGFSGYLTIRDISCILSSMYKKHENQRFFAMCEEAGLPGDKQLKELSTGMRTKLKLLIALSHAPDFLILDEPTVGLDVIARDEMLKYLRTYMEEDENRSILISSHISSDLEGMCDDIYMIHEGSIVFHEEMDLLLSNYALLKLNVEQFNHIDKQYILRYKKEPYGFCCITGERQFYIDNYPDVVVEKGNVDDLMIMMTGGDRL